MQCIFCGAAIEPLSRVGEIIKAKRGPFRRNRSCDFLPEILCRQMPFCLEVAMFVVHFRLERKTDRHIKYE